MGRSSVIILSLLILIFSNTNGFCERFIPLELFTGGEIRDDNEIRFTIANKVFGSKKRKKITGPENWTNPINGKNIKVYRRTRAGQSGLKTQLFTITNNGQCMGRVWDSRRGGKLIENGCKFPLGIWKKNEKRTFLGSSGGKPRKIEIKILKLGKKNNSKLIFNWKLYDASDKLIDNNDYTFSPGKAMSALIDR
ncbi:MAG: hypothetical protein CMI85_01390 [Candidatus Pelagibacter sp.]|nr:hypothetical protein [Candidatus Pelagibacter sp.]